MMSVAEASQQQSALANRRDVVTEHNRQRQTVQELKRLERKKAKAEALEEKMGAQETGEDLERKSNWDYTIEDNERWEKKKAKKQSLGQFEFADYDEAARVKYKKDLDTLKPDMAAYNARKAMIAADEAADPNELMYRDANSFVYGDHKPSEDQIDRVVKKLNEDIDKRQKRSRKRKEENGEVTWISERNKVFNAKLSRFYGAYGVPAVR